MNSWVQIGAYGLLLAAIAGCGDGRPRAYPVRGTVLVNGEPAAGAIVTLIPDEPFDSKLGVPKSVGVVNAAGDFALSTYGEEDGAPVGLYGVSIVWTEEVDPTADPESVQPVDRLDGRYFDPKITGLEVEVKNDDNDLGSIELDL